MKTELTHTHYVAICDDSGREEFHVIWGIVIYDERGKFKAGDYVTSSKVCDFDLDLGYFQTQSGTRYLATTGVTCCQITLAEFPYLRAGLSPNELRAAQAFELEGHGKVIGVIKDLD